MSSFTYKRIVEESDHQEGEYTIGATATLISLESHNQQNVFSIHSTSIHEDASGNIPLLSAFADDAQTLPSSITAATAVFGNDGDTIDQVDFRNEEEERKKKPLCHRLKGIMSILFATSLVSLNNQILYYLYDKINIPYSKSLYLTTAFLIYTVQNLIPLMYTMYKNSEIVITPLKEDRRLIGLLALRGMMGSSVQFLTSHAIDRFGKPAPVSVITAMAPIFVYINAYFVLKEKLGIIPIVNVFVAIAGVIVMNLSDLMGHKQDFKTLEATGFALACMFLLSWITVIIRFLRNVHPWLINLAFGLGGILVQGSIVIYENSNYYIDDHVVLGFCFATATLTTVGNFFYNMSLKYESAGVVSLMRTTDVVYSFLFQFCFFGLNPDVNTSIGGAMVLFGVICVTLRKIVGESSETSRLRRHLWFLLY